MEKLIGRTVHGPAGVLHRTGEEKRLAMIRQCLTFFENSVWVLVCHTQILQYCVYSLCSLSGKETVEFILSNLEYWSGRPAGDRRFLLRS